MNIGAASAASGVSAKMVRHYEAIGLLRPALRRENSYRDYCAHDVHELQFIGRARKLGFSLTEIAELVALWRDKARPSRDVRQIAARHLDDLEKRIAQMRSMADAVRQLVKSCHGDDRTDCPILSDLSGETPRRREGVAARAHAKPNAASATTTPRHGALQMLGGKKRPAASRKSPGVSTAPVKIGP